MTADEAMSALGCLFFFGEVDGGACLKFSNNSSVVGFLYRG